MTDQHPLTPPLELVVQWIEEDEGGPGMVSRIASRSAQWSADQELEACIAWMIEMGYWGEDGQAIPLLRAARRPKPPSLKEQALEDLEQIDGHAVDQLSAYVIHGDLKRRVSNIRRALESLPDD